jgi:radical SAM superfamily enzyme YgiQ (UPF0313 family)
MNRDEIMLQKVLALSQKTDIKNPYKHPYKITKKTDMWFIMLPQWSHFLPPFGLARLSSILLEEGFYTRCLDLNIKAWNITRDLLDVIGYDPWDSPRTFKWGGDTYSTELHPHYEELFNTAIESIVLSNPKVIGFTVYHTNSIPVNWMVEKLRLRLPETIFIAGGPSSISDELSLKKYFDIIVVGEAEKIIIDVLNEIENGTIDSSKFPLVLTQPSNERLDLNQFPIPNYSEFDTNEYRIPNAIVSEFSRGCVAKCTFCMETHFWNYRQKGYMKVVDELEHLNKYYGINAVWFVDSLLNGNLTELKSFAQELINRDLKISWFGYGRHDSRMDLEYLQLLKKSGLVAFQFGSESGSNKVLEDMKKRVTKEEMEQNFIDGAKVGIQAVTGWVVGFPTETTQDFVDTMTIIWRNRNTCISNITASQRFFMDPLTIVGQNPDRFGLLQILHEDCQLRKDFTLGIVQLLIRAKSMTIFLHELKSKNKLTYLPRPTFKLKHYNIKYNHSKVLNDVEFEDFDYNIVNTNTPYQDSAINEPFGLFRLLWKTRGGYKLKINFNPEIDLEEFGPALKCNLNGYFEFNIDDVGRWNLDVDLKYIQSDNSFKPFPSQYYEPANSAIMRARKLAKPEWGLDGVSSTMYDGILEDIYNYNLNVNLSFDYTNKLQGNWQVQKKSLF